MKSRLAVVLLLLAGLLLPGVRADAVPAFVEVVRTMDLGPGLNGVGLKARCPDRTTVISGGVQLGGGFDNNEVHIVGTHPFDGRDRDKKPDDGWIGRANNYSGKVLSLRTYAICTKRLQHRYVQTSFTLGSGDFGLSVDCDPAEEVVGGGVSLSARSARHRVGYSSPRDNASDGDAIRNNGWIASVSNQSGVQQTMTIFAICTSTGLNHPSETVSAPVTGNFAAAVSYCAEDRILVGGGVAITTSTDEFMIGTRPTHGGDTTTSTDDGWVGFSSVAASPVDMTVTAICLPT